MTDEHISDTQTDSTNQIVCYGAAALAFLLFFGRGIGGVLLVFALLIGAAIFVISAIWKSGGERRASEKELTDLRARLAEMEERLAAAETIEAFEDRLAKEEAAARVAAEEPEVSQLEDS
jgi:hypothetical protein